MILWFRKMAKLKMKIKEKSMNKIIFKDYININYQEALELQKKLFEHKIQRKQKEQKTENHLFFCEHTPVYTLGKRGSLDNLLINQGEMQEKGIDFYHIQRGGDITFHGKGQITAYPIFDLENFGLGLREYVEKLEKVIIQTLAKYNLEGKTIQNATGVWIEDNRKICAIGIRSSRWITMHGFAFNIKTDLKYFDYINPCGFTDKGVTSLEKELGDTLDIEEVKRNLLDSFEEVFEAKVIKNDLILTLC